MLRKKDYRDLQKWKNTARLQRKRYYAKTALYAPRPWTSKEEQLVLEHTIPDSELSPLIQRSVAAIQKNDTNLKSLIFDKPYTGFCRCMVFFFTHSSYILALCI